LEKIWHPAEKIPGAELAKSLYHLFHFEKLLNQPIDIRNGRAAALSNPSASAPIQDSRIAALLKGH
jgi:hypothetical protein